MFFQKTLRFSKKALKFSENSKVFKKKEKQIVQVGNTTILNTRLKFVKSAFTHITLAFHNKQLADNTLHSNSCESSLKRHSLYRPKCSFLFS